MQQRQPLHTTCRKPRRSWPRSRPWTWPQLQFKTMYPPISIKTMPPLCIDIKKIEINNQADCQVQKVRLLEFLGTKLGVIPTQKKQCIGLHGIPKRLGYSARVHRTWLVWWLFNDIDPNLSLPSKTCKTRWDSRTILEKKKDYTITQRMNTKKWTS